MPAVKPTDADRRIALIAAVGVVIAAAGIFIATRSGFFYADDFGNLGLARDQRVGRTLLMERYFGHLSPGHRIVDWLVVRLGINWAATQLLMLAALVIGAAAMYDLVRRVSGRAWLAAALAIAFTASPVSMRTVEWLASGALIIPATTATLISLAAAMRWFDGQRVWWGLLAILAFAVAVAFYEKPLLTPAYLFFLRYLAGDRFSTTNWRSARNDAKLWAGYVLVGVIYIVAVTSGPGLLASSGSSLHAWIEYARIVWLRGSTPLVIGAWPSIALTTRGDIIVLVSQFVFFGLVALSIWLRPRAWRAWVFYVIALAVNAGLIGSGRLADFGSGIGIDLRYNSETVIILPLAIAAAFSIGLPQRRSLALSRRFQIVLVSVLAGLFVFSSINTYKRLHEDWPGYVTPTYLATLQSDAVRLGATGRDPRASILDGPADFAFGPILQPPYNQLSQVLSMVGTRDVSIGADADMLLLPVPGGHLQPVVERPVADSRRPARKACVPEQAVELVLKDPGSATVNHVLRFTTSNDSVPGIFDVFVGRGTDTYGGPEFSVPVQPGQQVFHSLGTGPVNRALIRPAMNQPVCVSRATVTELAVTQP